MDKLEIKKGYKYAIRFPEAAYISIYMTLVLASNLAIFLMPEIRNKIKIIICLIEALILAVLLIKFFIRLKMCNRVLENLEILETKVNVNTSWFRRSGRTQGVYAFIESSYFDEETSRIYIFNKKESLLFGPLGLRDNPINEKNTIYVLVNKNNYNEYIVLVKEYFAPNKMGKQEIIAIIILFVFIFILSGIVYFLEVKTGIKIAYFR